MAILKTGAASFAAGNRVSLEQIAREAARLSYRDHASDYNGM